MAHGHHVRGLMRSFPMCQARVRGGADARGESKTRARGAGCEAQSASHARARQGHNAQNKAIIPDSAFRADNTSISIARGTRGPAHTCADITASHAAHMHGAQSARLCPPTPSPFTRADNSRTKQGTAQACGRGTRACPFPSRARRTAHGGQNCCSGRA